LIGTTSGVFSWIHLDGLEYSLPQPRFRTHQAQSSCSIQ
jgi:hypothetical protein